MMEMSDMTDYNGAEVITGIRKPTLYGMVSKKDIPHFRLSGRIVRFSKKELAKWLEKAHRPAQDTMKASNS